MTREDKQLLFKDLCARLLYGVICHTEEGDGHLCSINQTAFGIEYGINSNSLRRYCFSDSETDSQAVKPYLRPASSMTEKEKKYYDSLFFEFYGCCFTRFPGTVADFLNRHMFDYRGLIPMGLALKAKEGMYKTE